MLFACKWCIRIVLLTAVIFAGVAQSGRAPATSSSSDQSSRLNDLEAQLDCPDNLFAHGENLFDGGGATFVSPREAASTYLRFAAPHLPAIAEIHRRSSDHYMGKVAREQRVVAVLGIERIGRGWGVHEILACAEELES